MNLRELPHATAGSKFCAVPKAAVALCPNLGWGKDFFDAQSFLDPMFNGANIAQTSNGPSITFAMENAVAKATDAADKKKKEEALANHVALPHLAGPDGRRSGRQ